MSTAGSIPAGTTYRLSTSKAIDCIYDAVFDTTRRPHRPASWHPRHADSPDPAVGAAARLRDRTDDSRPVLRGPAGGSGVAVSGAAAAREERVGHREMGSDQ